MQFTYIMYVLSCTQYYYLGNAILSMRGSSNPPSCPSEEGQIRTKTKKVVRGKLPVIRPAARLFAHPRHRIAYKFGLRWDGSAARERKEDAKATRNGPQRDRTDLGAG